VWTLRAPTLIAAGMLLLIPWTGPQLNQLSTPILTLALICYSLGRWVANLRGLVGIGLLLVMFLVDYLFIDVRSHNFTDVVFVATLAIPPYVFGRISQKLALQSEQLARQQALIRDEAVRAERDRIARELHDVIAHSLSAMVVQTAAAQDLVRRSPDRADALLQSVADTGRTALEETGRLLHLIRDDVDELGLRPAPGLADVPAPGGDVPRERARGGGRPYPADGAAVRRRGRLGVPRGPGASHQRPEVRSGRSPAKT